MEEIIAHLAQQAWSSGKIIAAGRSYLADTADMATTRHAPALVALIPRETDFDFYDLFWPVVSRTSTCFWAGVTTCTRRTLDEGRHGRTRQQARRKAHWTADYG